MRPLLNVLYAKGMYHIYQADTLLNEPGLSAELSKKTKIDRYFVTNQIKSIAGKASIVVADSKIPELEKALDEDENKHLKALKPFSPGDSDEEDIEFLDPLYHEARAQVSIPNSSYNACAFVFKQGVVLDTGDVIRLGRVCYIVKESSIELGEQALKACASYAEEKTKKRWDTLIR